jgi:HK97 gp10 family phage protein
VSLIAVRTRTEIDLAAPAARIERLARDALATAAEGIAAEARARAARRSGTLAGAIASRADGDGFAIVALAPHAAFVELGTARAPARPFLRPALEAGRAGLAAAIARAIGA